MAKAKETVPKYLEEGLLALVPCYLDGGNACRIFTRVQDYADPHSLRWLLTQLAAYFGTSVKLLQEQYGPFLNRTLTVPLPLSGEVLLLPLKMREARVPGDTTIGYINGLSIDRVEPAPAPYRSAVHFREGLVLESYSAPGTVRERLLQGHAVYREFLRRQQELFPPPGERLSGGQAEEEIIAYALEVIKRKLTKILIRS
jgi:hypothetical protein